MEFRLIMRFGEHKPDMTMSTHDPTSFIRTLNAALAIEKHQPVTLWAIEHKNKMVATHVMGSPVFIDASSLERLGCPLASQELDTFTLSEGFSLA